MVYSENQRILLMGSSGFRKEELPSEVKDRINSGIKNKVIFIVAEAHGSCRLFQDYLFSIGYRNVIVGHAKSMRYNAGSWRTRQYGNSLKERERNMIEDCDSAILIWQDFSGVIADNLEYLKKLGIPTFLYEYSYRTGKSRAGLLDPLRTYSPQRFGKKERKKPRDTLLDYM